MRVLIGHDGSSYADAAMVDLARAGLPKNVEAVIVTVGDAPLVAPFASHRIIEQTFVGERVLSIVEHANKQAAEALSDVRGIAQNAALKLSTYFPSWKVRSEAVAGRPADQLIRMAAQGNQEFAVRTVLRLKPIPYRTFVGTRQSYDRLYRRMRVVELAMQCSRDSV